MEVSLLLNSVSLNMFECGKLMVGSYSLSGWLNSALPFLKIYYFGTQIHGIILLCLPVDFKI